MKSAGDGPDATHLGRLAFFLPTLDGGGAERALIAVATALHHAGTDVRLVVGDATVGNVPGIPEGVQTTDLGRPHVRRSIGALTRYLRDVRPTCLISTLDHANVVALIAARAAGSRTRTIVRVANTLSQVWRHGAFHDRLTLRAVRRFYPYADAVVVPAPHVGNDLAVFAGLRRSAIHVIPNPVIGPQFKARSMAALEDPWFAPRQPPVILGVGRLVEQKHFDLLVRAFAIVRDEVDARLLILGEGPERSALEHLIDELGLRTAVRLPGHEANPLRFMSRAEVVASSSKYEGSPAVLIQALACDAKVVATDCPGGTSDILGRGTHGWLVPNADVKALAAALKKAVVAPRRPNDSRSWQPYRLANSVDAYRDVIRDVSNAPLPAAHVRAS